MLAAATAPAVLARLTAAPTAGRPDALARLLVVDGWGARTRAALTRSPASPQAAGRRPGQSRIHSQLSGGVDMDTVTRRRFLLTSGWSARARWPPEPARTACGTCWTPAETAIHSPARWCW
ncbi:hypothetical protein NKG94_30810 [Micromonospora sp. M12]